MSESGWRERIDELVLVKQKLREVDSKGLWEYRLPAVAASEEQLAEVEARLGEPLDPSYRRFLSYAGGWPAFMQDVDLFGPSDLLGGSRHAYAKDLLGYMEEIALIDSGVDRDDLLPIAVTPQDRDLFVMTRSRTAKHGQVIWFSGGEIERYPNFDEFFAAMVHYNRSEIERLGKAR